MLYAPSLSFFPPLARGTSTVQIEQYQAVNFAALPRYCHKRAKGLGWRAKTVSTDKAKTMSWMRHSRRGGHPVPPPERENSIVMAISNGDRGWLTTLLRAGADANAPHRGTVPLHMAARRGEFDVVDLLIAHGAKIDGRDDAGRSALMIAAGSGEANEIAGLFQRGADVDATDKDGNTAAHHAVHALRFDHLARLIRAGGDADAANHAGETPRSLCAAEGGHALSVLEQAEKDRAKIAAAEISTLQQSITLMPPLRFKPRSAGPR
jgi:hypothetical protein